MKIIHQQWQIVGQVFVVDEEGNAIIVGKDAQGNDTKIATVIIGVDKFRGNAFQEAYQRARKECDILLLKHVSPIEAQSPKEEGRPGECRTL
jgi:hypothetical protein